MKKIAFLLMALTVTSKIFGFSRDIVLSYFYGTSSVSDAYLIAMTIPVTIFSFIGIAITTSYVPVYIQILKEKSNNEANQYTSNLINILMLLSLFITISVLIFAEPIVLLFAFGFEEETLSIAVLFTKICIVSIFLFTPVYVFNAFLQAKNKFYSSVLVGIPLNLISIVAIYLSSTVNLLLLPIGSVIAIGSQLLFLYPTIKKNKFKYKFVLNLRDKYLSKVVYLSIPVILGTSLNQINMLVDRTLASQIVVGGISALTYANKLNLFIQGIFVMSLVTVLYPSISRMVSEGRINDLKDSLKEYIVIMCILILPISVATMVFSEEIITILFGRGAFDIKAIELTETALFFYAIGIASFGLRELLSRVFYSFQDTKSPMINASIGIILNVILNIILSKFLGIGGLALATSISGIVTTSLMFISLRKKIGSFMIKDILWTSLKVIISSCFAVGISRLLFESLIVKLDFNLAVSLTLALFVGILIYLVTIFLFRIKEFHVIVNIITARFWPKTI
ncbi:murein biosynthesis integral membrane protein MurJ [Indiicoccus explosivorum]|uniref:murein biosynthesis integral membrane protein MurJ n=1 Tax=Indiicoccus explosivorum TaxID=1917864 RepID=UPI000B44D2E2|nr:murein biosynthesis integral membrane protein MurJ [Indiicoccus explosivorum]